MTAEATRRQRIRAETVDDIKAAALGELRAVGAARLSLRAVAGALGMSPAGLYRYYDSREALLTALIADGFDALAGAVAAGRDAAGDDCAPRMAGAAQAYRGWALAHPHEFGLLYGDPIPGYTAPVDGVTSEASRGVGAALLPPLAEAREQGRLRVPDLGDGEPAPGLRVWADALRPPMPLPAAALVLGVWGRLHGLVVLEVFGHLHWIGPGAGTLVADQLRALVDEVIAPPSLAP